MKPVVLSVEDDPFFRTALGLVLTQLGIEITLTETVEEFRAASIKLKPQLFLIDLQLATGDGLNLIPDLKKSHRDAVIIVVSGDSDPARITAALERGATDYIQKPIDRTLLASKLSQYLNTQPLRDHTASTIKLEEKKIVANLTVPLKIISVDEMGVTFTSANLFPKKTVLRLRADFFKKLDDQLEDVLVTIVSSYVEFQTGTYRFYAEFDESNAVFLENLRRWMLVNSKKV
jgi:DNA-binding response OmpR family regulator